MIRHTAQVVAALGAANKPRGGRVGIGLVCEECRGDFTATQSNALYCEPCKRQRRVLAARRRRAELKARKQAG